MNAQQPGVATEAHPAQVQVIAIKEITDSSGGKRYRCTITDGVDTQYCMMSSGSQPLFADKHIVEGTVIRISGYSVQAAAGGAATR